MILEMRSSIFYKIPLMRVVFRNSKQVCSVEAFHSLNLLAHAQIEELETGSRCGGHGHCGGDRIRILAGQDQLTPPTQAEREHLSDEELRSGIRLACQTFLKSGAFNIEAQIISD